MSYLDPESIVEIFTKDQDTFLSILRIQSHRMNQALVHVFSTYRSPPIPAETEVIAEACSILNEHIECGFSHEMMVNMFLLFPVEASVVKDDPRATDAVDALLDMFAMCYLNSHWPMNYEDIGQKSWTAACKAAFAFHHAQPAIG
jgi:hypothetical protein